MLALHLKRFEFDFSREMHIKLNDRFEFPLELDMYPYTDKALAKEGHPIKGEISSSFYNLSKQLDEDPDYYMYDLVGVSIHSGSANSGHYYSFIKERTDGSDSSTEGNWCEFNDTTIRPFDLEDLDRSAFGGSEVVTSSVGQGLKKTMQRTASAYMLFYRQRKFARTGLPTVGEQRHTGVRPSSIDPSPASAASSSTDPEPSTMIAETRERRTSFFQTGGALELPRYLAAPIWESNQVVQKQKFLFDSKTIRLLWQILQSKISRFEENEEAVATLMSEDRILLVVDMIFKFSTKVVCRSFDAETFGDWMSLLFRWCRLNQKAFLYLSDIIAHGVDIRQLLLVNHPLAEVRRQFADFVSRMVISVCVPCMEQYSRFDPHTYSIGLGALQGEDPPENVTWFVSSVGLPALMTSIVGMMSTILDNNRRVPEYFRMLSVIAEECEVEREFMVSMGVVSRIVDLLQREFEEMARGLTSPSGVAGPSLDSQRVSMGAFGGGPSSIGRPMMLQRSLVDVIGQETLQRILYLLKALVCSCGTAQSAIKGPPPTCFPPLSGEEQTLTNSGLQVHMMSLSEQDTQKLFNKSFISRILDESVGHSEALYDILLHWCWECMDISENMINMVMENLDRLPYTKFPPFLYLLESIVCLEDSVSEERIRYGLGCLLALTKHNIHNTMASRTCIRFLVDLGKGSPGVQRWVSENMPTLQVVCTQVGLKLKAK